MQLDPRPNKLHYLLTMAYHRLGQEEKSRIHMEQRGQVGIRPDDPLLEKLDQKIAGSRKRILDGRTLYKLGMYPEAAESYAKALEATPGDVGIMVNLAVSYVKLGRNDEARKLFEEAIHLAPWNLTARFNLGSLLIHMGNPRQAIVHLKVVTEKLPEDPQSHLIYADALFMARDYPAALEHYNKAAELDPNLESAWLGSVRVSLYSGRFKQAMDVLAAASTHLPENESIQHTLARQLAASQEPSLRNGERAMLLAQKVFAAKATWQRAQTVALACAEAGFYDQAASWQQKALELAVAAEENARILEMLQKEIKTYKTKQSRKSEG